jgi:hypothetical protein
MTVWMRVGDAWVTTHRDSDCMYCFFWGQFAETMTAIDSEWAGKPAPDHPCTDYREDDAVSCLKVGARLLSEEGPGYIERIEGDAVKFRHTDGTVSVYSYAQVLRFAEMDRAEAHRSGPRAPFVGGPESTS